MRITLFFAAIIALALASCQKEGKRLKTSNGYEYVNHTNVDGALPQPGDYVYFHAQMRNADSVLFSSRVQSKPPFLQIPVDSDPNRRVSPVEDVLKLMRVGDSVTIFINIDTLPSKPRGFENASEMLYDVVLLEIKSADQFMQESQKAQAEAEEIAAATRARAEEVAAFAQETLKKYKSGALKDEIKETADGLKYVIHEEGSGPQAQANNVVVVQYYGMLTDGTMFDNSFDQGSPISFPLGQGRVIPGWDEGLALLKKGAKATLFIPYQLAYGEEGRPPVIPEKAELVFYVELADVQ
ncbi:MAG: FKBP-type peptidyl-prolyl cis-trans isomerase [Phaeodactylibacter sp.]|nr:FKBP-type peptidyl-prolyl cis-trans isomerase [Phaeodactylibacter sp.]